MGGGVEYGFTGSAISSAYVNGQKTISFANVENHTALWLYGQKDIKSVADLKGKTLITAAAGTSYESFANYAIKQGGMEPNKDVKLVNIAGSGDRQAAFLRNSAEAMVTGTPLNYQLDAEGYPIIMDFTSNEVIMMPLTTTPEYYAANMDQNIALVKALTEANKFIKENKEKAIESLSKWTNSSAEDATKAYETAMQINAFPEIPRIDEEAFMFLLQNSSDEKLKGLTVEDTKQIYTNEIIDKLESEGFFK